MRTLTRRLSAPTVGLAVVALFAGLSVRPEIAVADDGHGAAIRFSATSLNPKDAQGLSTSREVAPSLERIRPWISAVGAAVGLGDLDGDGKDAEACLVDPRDDSVQLLHVAPSPSREGTARLMAVLRTPAEPRHTAPMGCVPADWDSDGDQDVMVYFWGRSPVVHLNLGHGARWKRHELVSPVQVWNSTAMNVADFDGDGALDVLIGNYFPDGAAVLDPSAKSDGRMAMQDSMSRARNAGLNRLFLSRPRARDTMPLLTDASTSIPPDSQRSWTLALGAQDLTTNGLPDLYVGNDFGPDQLLVNTSSPGHVRFTEAKGGRDLMTAGSGVLGRDSFKGMGVAFTHLNADALPSIVVSNISSEYALQESNFFYRPSGRPSDLFAGRAPYQQEAESRGIARSGWSWDVKALDADGDGREELAQATGFVAGSRSAWPLLQELAMSNDTLLQHAENWFTLPAGADLSGHDPNRLWCLQADRRYRDCGPSSGFDNTTVARGMAVGDIDGDLRPDVLVANQWADSMVYRNVTEGADSWLWLRVRRPARAGGTEPAIGAAVVLDTPAGRQYRQLYPANGHAGVSSSELSFGLGHRDGAAPSKGTVHWRDVRGVLHSAPISLEPGRHELLLDDTGKVTTR